MGQARGPGRQWGRQGQGQGQGVVVQGGGGGGAWGRQRVMGQTGGERAMGQARGHGAGKVMGAGAGG